MTMTFLNTALTGGAVVMVSPLVWCEGEFGGRAIIVCAGALSSLLLVAAAVVIRNRPEDIGLLS